MTSQTLHPPSPGPLFFFPADRTPPPALPGRWTGSMLVETIGFDYGQRHAVELTCREKVRIGMASLKEAWATRVLATIT
jgi:hypothetical protein